MPQEDMDVGKILVVDDDELVTKTLRLIITSQTPYEVCTFNSPFEAVEYLKGNDTDLILSDFMMPDMNGIDFLIAAKKIKPSVTSILLTGYADKKNAIKAINEVGIYKYIEKPWNNDELLLNIKNAIERAKLIETVRMQKEIERLRNDFIATLTHDLRTPLLAAIQTLGFFLDGTMGKIDEKQTKFLSTMRHSNEDMLNLVNSLLEVYKYEAGMHILNKDNFNLVNVIQKCLEEVSSLTQEKNITINEDFPQECIIFGDKHEIKRVIMNFLGNAINHTKNSISIKVTDNGNTVKFSVTDNGSGISEEDLKKLFNRFSQGTSKKRSTGTGLGLYLSKQILDAHNGNIGVSSKIDKGSEFYFELNKKGTNYE